MSFTPLWQQGDRWPAEGYWAAVPLHKVSGGCWDVTLKRNKTPKPTTLQSGTCCNKLIWPLQYMTYIVERHSTQLHYCTISYHSWERKKKKDPSIVYAVLVKMAPQFLWELHEGGILSHGVPQLQNFRNLVWKPKKKSRRRKSSCSVDSRTSMT